MEFDKQTLTDLKDLRDEFAAANNPLSEAAKSVLNRVIYKGDELNTTQTISFLEHVQKMCVNDEDKEKRVSKVIGTVLGK